METAQRQTTQRLLQKFPQIRRWRPRRVNSEGALADPPAVGDESKALVYSLRNLAHDSVSTMSPEQCAHTIDQSLITGHNRDDCEPLVEFASSPVPRYTPMPIPDRMSSSKVDVNDARREQQEYGGEDDDSREGRKHADEADDGSFHLTGLEEEPGSRPPLPPPKEEEPPRGRTRTRPPAPSPPKVQPSPQPSSRAGNVPYNFNNGLDSSHQVRARGSVRTALSGSTATARHQQLPPLQNPLADKCDVPHTELYNVDDPDSWDVIKSSQQEQLTGVYSLEERAAQLYSNEHLSLILDDPKLRLKFSNFVRRYRPWRLPVLAFYWKAYKAIKALQYTNSLIETLSDSPPTLHSEVPKPNHSLNPELLSIAQHAFEELRREDLHYFIAHAYIQIVSAVVQRRIMGNLAAHLRETSHGLAEVFCITDPSRPNNPIILASQEFTRHSGCALNYILGRNCNFMQGPGTTMDSRRRFAVTCAEGRDHTEIFVNYRRDGSPFLSLVMNAPLIDSRGKVRYFLGAQVDVSGLLKECSGMPSLQKLVEQKVASRMADAERTDEQSKDRLDPRHEIKALSQLFNAEELDIIRKHGGYLLQGSHYVHTSAAEAVPSSTKPPRRVLIEDGVGDGFEEPRRPPSQAAYAPTSPIENQTAGSLEGVYKHYLLVRPYPSLRILFASPRLREPGMLQSHFLHRIGNVGRLRQELEVAFREGHAVTAKVKWLDQADERGEGEGGVRWVHCTPLMHYGERVGLWMVVVVLGEEVGSVEV